MKSLMILFFYLSFFLSQDVFSQAKPCAFKEMDVAWTGGGAYPRIQLSQEKIYLISDVSGIWQASLTAPAWEKSMTGLDNLAISNIEFSKKDPLRGYATTKVGISTTDNGGLSWSTIHNLPDTAKFTHRTSYRNIAINPTDPTSFFFADSSGDIYEYTKGQANKIISTHLPSVISSLILFNSGSHLLLGSGRHRLLYEKINFLWELKNNETLPAVDMESIIVKGKEVIVSVGGEYVSISADQARSWFQIDIANIIGKGIDVNRVSTAVNKNGDLSILISWSKNWQSGILVSTDNGQSWRDPIKKLNFAKNNPTFRWRPHSLGRILSVYIDKKNSNSFYISTYWGIWHSSDEGKVWYENFKTGAANTVGSEIVIAENGDLITASMDIGLLRYHRDEFTKETMISTIFPNSKNYHRHKWVAGHFWNIILSGKRMIATNSPWSSTANQIVISEDQGDSWQIINNGLPENYKTENTIWEKGYARALVQDSINKNKFYLGIDGQGIFISEDGGYHWLPSFQQPYNLRIYNGLAVDSVHNLIYWGTVGGGVYLSRDNGRSWDIDGLQGKNVFDLQLAGDGTLYAGVASTPITGAALIEKRSPDSSWQLVQDFALTGTVEAITIDPKQERRIIISVNGWSYNNNGKIFISNDKGLSWKQISGEFGIGAADMVISQCSNLLYITGYSGGVSVVNLTPYIR